MGLRDLGDLAGRNCSDSGDLEAWKFSWFPRHREFKEIIISGEQETVNKLRHAKVVVSTIGAHFSNLFFCQDAIIIAIYPDDLPRLSESVSQLSFDLSIVHSLPAFRNLILLKCKVDLSASVRNILDFPAIVEVDKLIEIVRHAKVIAG